MAKRFKGNVMLTFDDFTESKGKAFYQKITELLDDFGIDRYQLGMDDKLKIK